MDGIRVIAFDADDTLWANESIFSQAQDEYKSNLEHYVSHKEVEEKLYETERKNLKHFGYGIKGFMLSMIETAIEITDGRISGKEINQIIELGKWMLDHPVEVLPGVEDTLKTLLKYDFKIMVITKGDLFDQEGKIARSGIADFFHAIEIVSEKDEKSYNDILEKYDVHANEFLMVGNSLKSDIIPVRKLGAHAVHIPFHVTWVLEQVSEHHLNGLEYEELSDISLLPKYLNLNAQDISTT